MTSKFDDFKDAEMSADFQEIINGGLTPSESASLNKATKNGKGQAEAFRIMVARMKVLEEQALARGDFATAKIHEAERCKMELTLGRSW